MFYNKWGKGAIAGGGLSFPILPTQPGSDKGGNIALKGNFYRG
jgi:hypothetical protein